VDSNTTVETSFAQIFSQELLNEFNNDADAFTKINAYDYTIINAIKQLIDKFDPKIQLTDEVIDQFINKYIRDNKILIIKCISYFKSHVVLKNFLNRIKKKIKGTEDDAITDIIMRALKKDIRYVFSWIITLSKIFKNDSSYSSGNTTQIQYIHSKINDFISRVNTKFYGVDVSNKIIVYFLTDYFLKTDYFLNNINSIDEVAKFTIHKKPSGSWSEAIRKKIHSIPLSFFTRKNSKNKVVPGDNVDSNNIDLVIDNKNSGGKKRKTNRNKKNKRKSRKLRRKSKRSN
jgi:hypothetical protein